MQIEIEKLIQNILLHELTLPEYYSKINDKIVPTVYIVSPFISLGNTDKLQVGIQSIGSQIVGNNVRYKKGEKLTEVKECVVSDNIQIDIKSRNNEARQRRFEVLTALVSTYSKYMQEKYKCRIFNIPSGFTNTQGAEGATLINRYTITISTQYLKVYEKDVDYYDKFSIEGQVDTEDKFNIELQDKNMLQ